MSAHRSPLCVLAILVAISSVGAAADYKNDANSGSDAPDTEGAAYVLPDYGSYTGYLMPTDNDWYQVNRPAGPSCVETRFSGNATGTGTLVVVDGTARRVASAPLPTAGTILAFASPNVSSVRFGVTSPAVGYYPHGEYAFSLATTGSSGVGDAGTGADASDSPSAATRVGPGCVRGTLSPGALVTGDRADAYVFDAVAGGVAVFSFAATSGVPTILQITDGSNVLATLASGDVAQVTFPTTGSYYMTASTPSFTATGTVDYLVGMIIGPPDPCRPMCLSQ